MWILKFVVLLFISITVSFQNCGGGSFDFAISQLKSQESGIPFLDKPEEGDYIRTHSVAGCNTGNSLGVIKVSNATLRLTQDLCDPTNIQIPISTPLLTYTSYNPDYFGLASAIFEKVLTISPEALPATEAWCKAEDNLNGLDVIIRVGDSQNATAKFYLGTRDSSTQAWRARTVNAFAVNRMDGISLTYSSGSMKLDVQKSLSDRYTSAGQLTVKIDGVTYNKIMKCRLASQEALAPVINSLYVGTAIDNSQLLSDGGFAYVVGLSTGTPADDVNNLTRSTLRLFEDGVEIGPSHTLHADIRNIGRGRFSHWAEIDGTNESIRLTPTDNSDPRTNGRIYSYRNN